MIELQDPWDDAFYDLGGVAIGVGLITLAVSPPGWLASAGYLAIGGIAATGAFQGIGSTVGLVGSLSLSSEQNAQLHSGLSLFSVAGLGGATFSAVLNVAGVPNNPLDTANAYSAFADGVGLFLPTKVGTAPRLAPDSRVNAVPVVYRYLNQEFRTSVEELYDSTLESIDQLLNDIQSSDAEPTGKKITSADEPLGDSSRDEWRGNGSGGAFGFGNDAPFIWSDSGGDLDLRPDFGSGVGGGSDRWRTDGLENPKMLA